MNSPFPIDFSLDLLQSGQPTAIASSDGTITCSGKLFKDILADENLVSDIMAQLKEALPEELYAQIEEMVESGNGLPLAAIFSLESPLFQQILTEIPQTTLDALKLDGGTIPTILSSALETGREKLQKLGSDSVRVLDNLSSNINEAVSQTSAKGEETGIGKQIQELLASADSAPKAILPTSQSSDGSVSPNTAIGTAINGLTQLSNLPANNGAAALPPITAPMSEEAFGAAMGERIMWMMGKGIQGASIRINPPELGPIQVQLSVKNDQASVQMLVQHGAVKEALDAALPRLRDMLAESNLNLVNVDVSHRESPDQSSGSAFFDQSQREQMQQFLHDQELITQIEEEAPRYYRSSGLLDDYA